MTSLTLQSLANAARRLAAADPVLGASVERFRPPPLVARDPSHPTLVHLIHEQQVSLASTPATIDRPDQALATAAMEVADLRQRPTFAQLGEMAERWRPYRAVAARILWHHYLRVRGLPVE